MDLATFIRQTLCEKGFQEATGVQVTFEDGRTLTIHSDDHPALAQDVDEEAKPEVKPVQSAQGGVN